MYKIEKISTLNADLCILVDSEFLTLTGLLACKSGLGECDGDRDGELILW